MKLTANTSGFRRAVLVAANASKGTQSSDGTFKGSTRQVGLGGDEAQRSQQPRANDQITTPRTNEIQVATTSSVPGPHASLRRDTSSPASAAPPALPSVGRDQILATCVRVSALIGALGVGIHQLTPLVLPYATSPPYTALLTQPKVPTVEDIAIAAALAGGVSVARFALLGLWKDFRDATNASNRQVLEPLSKTEGRETILMDLFIVSVLPALSEEVLFRWALIPAIAPDWRGVAVAGAVFGAMHVTGGRNAAFAVWAGTVGCAYGVGFLVTGNLLVPIIAHALANAISAGVWIGGNGSSNVANDKL